MLINGVPPKHQRAHGSRLPGPSTEKPRTSSLDSTVEVYKAHIKCMIDDKSGILIVSDDSPDRLCYFELDDLNIDKTIDKMDIVLMMNRMSGVRVQLQARMIDDAAPIQYVSHVNGVQIVGDLPSFMRHVTLKRADISKVQSGHRCEKVNR